MKNVQCVGNVAPKPSRHLRSTEFLVLLRITRQRKNRILVKRLADKHAANACLIQRPDTQKAKSHTSGSSSLCPVAFRPRDRLSIPNSRVVIPTDTLVRAHVSAKGVLFYLPPLDQKTTNNKHHDRSHGPCLSTQRNPKIISIFSLGSRLDPPYFLYQNFVRYCMLSI